jgi:hypothetical protein
MTPMTPEIFTQRRKGAKNSIHLGLVSLASLRLCVINSSFPFTLVEAESRTESIDALVRRHLHFRLLSALAFDFATAAMLRISGSLAFNRLQAAAAWPGFT